MKSRILTAVIICIILLGCSNNSEKQEKGRFEIIESFKAFDNYYCAWGKIIKDRKTGRKYLYLWDGSGNGGPAITEYLDREKSK